MHNESVIFNKMAPIYIQTDFAKFKEDKNTGFLIVMSKDLNVSYYTDTAKEIICFINSAEICCVNDIYEHMHELYDVEEFELKKDIVEFIRELQWKNLVQMKKH